MILKMIIETISYTLIGSGEGSGVIDADIVVDEVGIPYIPSKKIKGILRECSIEVCEMLGLSIDLVENIFGKPGFLESKLRISNLYIPNYYEIKKEIQGIRENRLRSSLFSLTRKGKIISYFAVIRQQTSIDQGVAKEQSLRSVRVLKPGLTFEGKIDADHLSKREKSLLYLAVLNFRRIGTLRNRGFGEVKCRIEGLEIDDVNAALKNVALVPTESSEKVESFDPVFKSEDNLARIPVCIETLSPVLITKQIGDQNMVHTEKYIPATTLRGILAHRFIRLTKLNEAHKNPDFYTLFLKGDVLFTALYPMGDDGTIYYPTPLLLQKKKKEMERDGIHIYNVWEDVLCDGTKPIGGFSSLREDYIFKRVPNTVFYFHNARDRLSGTSTENKGAIFYYEAISKGEKFKGHIIGDKGILKGLVRLLVGKDRNYFRAYIGKSKTAQYGEVRVTFGNIEDVKIKCVKGDRFILTVCSPLILYNKYGFPEASPENIERYLGNAIREYTNKKDVHVEIKRSMAKVEFVESFVGVWGMKTPRYLAYSPGSCFEISVKNCPPNGLKYVLLKGIGEFKEYGFGQVDIITLREKYKMKISTREGAERVTFSNSTDLLSKILMSEVKEYFKYKGFCKAIDGKKEGKFGEITGHLIGKLEEMIYSAKDIEEWRKMFSFIEGKQSGERLRKAKLLHELREFYKDFFYRFRDQVEELGLDLEEVRLKNGFDFSKIYWLSFFSSLRMLKKREGRKNG